MIAFKIALRDLLGSRGFTLLFLFNLFLGVSGFVVLHSFRENINVMLGDRAKELLSSDLAISARRDLSEDEERKVEAVFADKVQASQKAMGVYSMARSEGEQGRSRLVQLKAVEDGFPYYGKIELEGEKNYAEGMRQLQGKNFVWLEPALLRQMKLNVGDSLRLGEMEFIAADIIKSDSTTSWSGVGLAPKVYISLENLKKTKLVTFGSVVTYSRLYKLKPQWEGKRQIQELKTSLEEIIKDPGVRVQAPESASEQVGRVLNYLSDYLGLVGLVALFLSGIGAGYLFQNYLFEKLQDVAILKSVGMGLGQIFLIYISQLAVLSFVAVVFASAFSWMVLPWISSYFYEWINLEGSFSMSWATFGLSFLVALGASVFICAPVLYKMVTKKVKNLFEGGQFFKWEFGAKDVLMYLPLLGFMWALAIVQAHSFAIGSVFTIALLVVVLAVSLVFPRLFSALDQFVLRKTDLGRPLSLSMGLATRYFARDRLSSTLSISAITIGAMLLSLIGQLEVSLKGELLDDPKGKPSLFLFDIQEEQKVGLQRLAQEKNLPLDNLSPMVRSRILKVNGEAFKRGEELEGFATREEERSQRFRNRGVNLSFYEGPNSSETLYEGKPFSGKYIEGADTLPELSIERRYAERLGIKLGDTMTFDILGIEVTGKVVNLRKVKWTSFVPNFFIVFQPGAIDDAPKTYLAAMGEMDFEERLRAQDLVVERFSNISVVNVSEVIEKVMAIFKAMALALGVMSGLCMLVGFFVLFAIIQNQLKKKHFEVAIQKVFGMEPSALLATLVKEYFMMAAISCVLGMGFSLALGQVVSILFFDGVWRIDWLYMAKIAGGIFLVSGLLSAMAGKTFYSLKVKTLLR